MESREEMVMLAEGGQLGKSGSNLSEAIGSPVREPPGKPGHRGCLSPGAAPYSRDRSDLAAEDSARRNMSADARLVGTSASGERRQADHHHKDGSSSDTESDFYEEIDVSCTPESMDYPTAKGIGCVGAGWIVCLCEGKAKSNKHIATVGWNRNSNIYAQ